MHVDLIIHNISKLYTPGKTPKRGKEMNNVTVLENVFIAVKDGKIHEIKTGEFREYVGMDTMVVDAKGYIALPGFIDSHTHLVHGGSREHEFAQKLAGVPYLDILKQGGGILSTVAQTRNATKEELYKKAYRSLNEMLKLGVTTLEAKSGYGLNQETELKQLEVGALLNENHVIDIHQTYLGAHAYPLEFKDNHKGYIASIKEDMSIVKEKELARFVDVFCEDSVFNVEETKELLEHAKTLGFECKIHADEIVSLGGASIAVDLNAISADHLMAISDEDIDKMGTSNTVANLLPSTSFYLNKEYANARKLMDANAIVSISSDYNPGSSPSENFQFVMQLAANKLRMTPYEVLTASTINAAAALGIDKQTGSLHIHKDADIVLLDVPNLEYTMYHFGVNHVSSVFKHGRHVVKDKQIQ